MNKQIIVSGTMALVVSAAVFFGLGAIGAAGNSEYEQACIGFSAELEYQHFCRTGPETDRSIAVSQMREAAERNDLAEVQRLRQRVETLKNSPQEMAWKAKHAESVKRMNHWMKIMEQFEP